MSQIYGAKSSTLQTLTVLGSTGSIGKSTLEVVARHPDKIRIFALTGFSQVDLLFEQCLRFKPQYALLVDPDSANTLRTRLLPTGLDVEVLTGSQDLDLLASHDSVDTVMASIVGAAGLSSCLAAARAGKRLLLANKEALVVGGELFLSQVRAGGAKLLPIDSEHNAIFQCMPAGYQSGMLAKEARRILLTASGGPFRQMPVEELVNVTPAQAVAHPNWDMGKKISVDSATMMNKGLEMIEACILFSMKPDQIQVVIHPQSIIHSMVDYVDGTVLAQMGNPDMRVPIAYSMAWPERFESGVEPLNIFDVRRMDFEEPNLERFPCLRLAYKAINLGGIIPTVLNAANEIAVEAFLTEQIRFTDIPLVIERCMDKFSVIPASSLEIILEADRNARVVANKLVAELTE